LIKKKIEATREATPTNAATIASETTTTNIQTMYQRQQQSQQQSQQPSQQPSQQQRQPQSQQQSQPQPQLPRKKGKPFCKVCFDAGKPETEYTSHYLRSAPGPDGKLVCPTLLNQSCLTCGQRGHTSSYCDKRNQHQPQDQSKHQEKRNRIDATLMSAEAELRRLTATFREPEESSHYNPKSNPFGALNEQIPKQIPTPMPMTMAEKLKFQSNVPKKYTPTTTTPKDVPPLLKPEFTGMPPKSQFWWQDE
jgi:hypothetical protein